MRLRRRALAWTAAAVLLLAVAACYVTHRAVAARVDRAVEEAGRRPPGLEVEVVPGHLPAIVEGARPRLWTDATRARDGASLEGRLLVATSGGLLELDAAGRAASLVTALDGLADHDLTALVARGGTLWAGTRSGLVLAVEGGRSRALRIAGGRLGAVSALAWHDGALYVATASGTLVRLEGEEARALGPEVRGGIAALAPGPGGLHVGGGDGAVYCARPSEGRLERVAPARPGHERVTALGWAGDQLLFAGTPTALLRLSEDGTALEEARADVFVTALLWHDGRLHVGTIDDGVLVLDPARPAATPVEHLLRGRRVEALREVDGRPVAFGPGLVATLSTAGAPPRLAELPEGIASDHVTALAFDAERRLWVGHFDDGVDVLDRGGRVLRHLPGPDRELMSSVNALAFDAASGTMLVATSHGVLEVGGDEVSVMTSEQGLIGEAVAAVLVGTGEGGGERVFATSRGLSFASGGVVRSIYAFHGLPSNRAYALARRSGRLYVGTLAGLAVVEGLRVREVLRAAPSGLSANWCAAVAAAPDGVYVGTSGGGVDLVLDDGAVRHLSLPGGEGATVNPGAMLVLDDRLLVGTLERGLLVYDRRRGEWLDPEGGGPLPGAAVTALVADDQDLYVGTDRGLLRLRRSALEGGRA